MLQVRQLEWEVYIQKNWVKFKVDWNWNCSSFCRFGNLSGRRGLPNRILQPRFQTVASTEWDDCIQKNWIKFRVDCNFSSLFDEAIVRIVLLIPRCCSFSFQWIRFLLQFQNSKIFTFLLLFLLLFYSFFLYSIVVFIPSGDWPTRSMQTGIRNPECGIQNPEPVAF